MDRKGAPSHAPAETELPLRPPAPRRRFGPKLKVKTGCLTCRQRRKKCDECKPQCNACSRLGYECVWPNSDPAGPDTKREDSGSGTSESDQYGSTPSANASQPDASDDPRLATSMVVHTATRAPSLADIGQSMVNSMSSHPPALRSEARLELFQYFKDKFTPLMTRPYVSSPTNQQVYLFSLAIQNVPLMDVMLACSAIHRSVQDAQFKAVSRSHYSASVTALLNNVNLIEVDGTEDWLILQVIYIYIFERWNTDPASNPITHLLGALELYYIRLAKSKDIGKFIVPSFERSVIESLLYHAAILPLFKGSSHRIPADLFDRLLPSYQFTPPEEGPHWVNSPLLGPTPMLFKWISEISHLIHRAPLSQDDRLHAIQLQNNLSRFSATVASLPAVDDDKNSIRQICAASSSRLFVISARILLFKLLSPWLSAANPILQHRVTDAFAIIESAPKEIRFDQYFCWPFLVLGFVLIREEHVELLRAKLEEMWQTSFCGDVKRVSEVLEKVWEATTRATTQPNFEQCPGDRNSSLDMLIQKTGLFDVFLGAK